MKRIYLNQIVSLFLIVLFVFTVSCKKDKLTDPDYSRTKNVTNKESEAEAIVKRIKTFERQLSDVKRGVLRNESYIDVDSAMWNIEALFNSTFSMPDEKYVEKKIQDLYFDLSVHRDNKLSIYEVNTLYENIIRSVKDAYINDGIDHDKGLMSIIVNKDYSKTRNGKLQVTLITGKTSKLDASIPPEKYIDGPFNDEDCWYFGEYGGSCDDPFLMTDAAELLEDTLNYYYGNTVSSKSSNYINLYVDMTIISLKGNEYKRDNGDNCLFYKVNCDQEELYLTGKELNEYYYWEKQVIFNKILNDSKYVSVLPNNPCLLEVNIDGLSSMSGNNIVYNHEHNILFGTKYELAKSVMGSFQDILCY